MAFDAGAQLKREDAGGPLPARIVVAPWGTHATAKGNIVINSRTVSDLPRNQLLSNFDRVALDFNHNTVPGSEAYCGEPAKVAAHATPRVYAGEGIVFEDVEWTAEGREYVGGKHYIDLSPTLQILASGEAVFIHSAAVCRQGAIPNLTLFNAGSPLVDAAAEKGHFRELLCLVLGIPADSSDAQIEAAARALDAPSTPSAIYLTAGFRDRAVQALNATRNGINDANVRLLAAVFPDPQALVQEAINARLGISPETAAKFGGC